jgi:hypothetical protein
MSQELEIEKILTDKGKTAPRLTPEIIDSVIVGEDCYVFPNTTLTVCVLKLRNGFVVTGESAAASPENFDADVGRRIARDNARKKVWMLEGYLLRQRLHELEPRDLEPRDLESRLDIQTENQPNG